MNIVLERIEFYNNEVVGEDGRATGIVPDTVDVSYNAQIGKEWVEGVLRDIPYNYYVNLSHQGLRDKIKERLQG